jgi:hypothetical protein
MSLARRPMTAAIPWQNRLSFKALLLVRDEDLHRFHGECKRDAPWTQGSPIEEQPLVTQWTTLLTMYNELRTKYEIADFRFLRDGRAPANAAWHTDQSNKGVVVAGRNFSLIVLGDETPISFSINQGCHTLRLAEGIFKHVHRASVEATFAMHADCPHSEAPPPTEHIVTLGDGKVRSQLVANWTTTRHTGTDGHSSFGAGAPFGESESHAGRTSQPGETDQPEIDTGVRWHRQMCLSTTGQPLDQAHSVSVSINLAYVTQRDLNRIATAVKQIVRAATKFSPHRPLKGQKHTGLALDFLRTITQERFALALKRYDSWVTGDTFSKIASVEADARLSGSPPRHLKGTSADQVEKDIKQIYLAIHRRSLNARRRRTEAPAVGFEQYHCPQHGHGCLEDCGYMNDWYRKARAVLPPDVGRTVRRPRRSARHRSRRRL